ncbi:MAG: hypothetical protein U0892_13905 [Pirellulales bacterium]
MNTLAQTTVTSAEQIETSLKAWERYNDEAIWKRLPELREGEKGRLPNWVKAVTIQMPRTAAALIELDTAQRTLGPLDPALKAKLRWVIAHANHSPYGEALAQSDYRRATKSSDDLQVMLADSSKWPAEDAQAFQFVRELSLNAPQIPDSLFESLRQKHEDRGVAAMVLHTAYGNFQDRLLLGLQVPVENDGTLPPLAVKFVDGALQRSSVLPPDSGKDETVEGSKSVVDPDPQWTKVSYAELQKRLEEQRDRKPRLPVPIWDEVRVKLPAEMTTRPTSIRWSLTTYGYAHELQIPWTTTTRTHWAELPSERIIEESLFWVQTRAVNCNYCMGHCEMLMEVAGLDQPAIAKRTRLLAETDWAAFPKSEQIAYAYARKLTAKPSELTTKDYETLEKEFGPRKAMSIFIWLCRGMYMTRISDGFQLPLERENVFGSHGPPPPTATPAKS